MQIWEEEGWIIIDGVRVEGHMTEECCPSCNRPLIYHETYDAHFCAFCNRWIEEACGDPKCAFCRDRPCFPLTRSC
jgi:hypothetical protein